MTRGHCLFIPQEGLQVGVPVNRLPCRGAGRRPGAGEGCTALHTAGVTAQSIPGNPVHPPMVMHSCERHQHPQRAVHPAVGRGVRHCYARGHEGQAPYTLQMQRGSVWLASLPMQGRGGAHAAPKQHRTPCLLLQLQAKEARCPPPPHMLSAKRHCLAGHIAAWHSQAPPFQEILAQARVIALGAPFLC